MKQYNRVVNRNHLKGLDTLRAIAAIIVVWGHIELFKKESGIQNLIDDGFYLPSGHISVILFFVISGFLITYLLTLEKKRTGTIKLKNFYLRRILRIWPLYYLVLVISFLLFKAVYSSETIFLSLTIFPNVAHALDAGWPTSPQIWSIGVEEQFYLFWPLILMILPSKRIPIFLILFFFIYTLLPTILLFLNNQYFGNETLSHFVNRFFYGSKFNVLSMGSLFGFLFAENKKYLRFFKNDLVSYVSLVLVSILWVSGFELKYYNDELFSILFSIAILKIVSDPRINLDKIVFRFIGKISYGIYMYHWIVLLLAFQFISPYGNAWLFNLYLYSFVFGITFFIAWVSNYSIERYFLKMKEKYR
ncbi:MAG TPA: acyltransferase [Chitinophagaceae bacterium]|nr:acyltransferase [Chitinophagaceae bacterium]